MRKPALLVALLAGLALFFGWKARTALHSPAPVIDNTDRGAEDLWRPGAPVPDPPPPPNTSAAEAAIAARPLFRQDRQPYHEQGAVGAVRNYEAELSRFALIGTLTFGGELKGIVVSRGAGASERWEVKAGDQLPGFTVKEVQIDGLALAADGRDFTLPLYAGAPAAGAGPTRTEIPRQVVSPRSQPAARSAPSAAQPPEAVRSGMPPVYIPEQAPSRPPRYYPRRR